MSEIVEVKQIPYKCDKCDHPGTVEAVLKRKPQKVIMEEGDDLSSIKKDLAELKAAKQKPVIEEKPKEVEVPSYLPKHFCNNPDGCEGHPNKGRKKVTKKCTDCDQVAPKKATKCAFCGNKDFEDLDDDDFEKYNKGMELDHEHE